MRFNRDHFTVDRKTQDESLGDRSPFAPDLISENMAMTPEGYLLCKNVKIASTDPMLYRPEEVPAVKPDPMKGQMILITRDPAMLFHADTLGSFQGKPVTFDHPDDMVDPKNIKRHFVGVCLDPRQGEGIDAKYMIADLMIMDAATIDAIKAGRVQISLGYDAESEQIELGLGKQVRVIGNHVALVSRARGGSTLAIRDGVKKMSKLRDRLLKFLDDAGDEPEGPAGQELTIRVVGPEGGTAVANVPNPKVDDEAAAAGNPWDKDVGEIRDMCSGMKTALDTMAEAIGGLVKSKDEKPEDDGEKKPDETEDSDTDTDENMDADSDEKEDDDYKTKDAATVETFLTGVRSKAEIIMPGMKMATTDSAGAKSVKPTAFMRQVLTKAWADGKRQALMKPLITDAAPDFGKMKRATVEALFNGASAIIGAANNTAITAGISTNDGVTGPMTPARYQEMIEARRKA